MVMPDTLQIVPLAKPPTVTIGVPGSKSITNRALVLAALASKGRECSISGALRSEDTEVMIECLQTLGFNVQPDWSEATIRIRCPGRLGQIPAKEAELFVGNSGTTMRFLTAMVSLGHGRYRLDGVPRMRERPIKDLLVALQQLGVEAHAENADAFPPVVVEARGLRGGTARVSGSISSQFLSAILMIAPFARTDVTLEVAGPLVSAPYVTMTLTMIEGLGVRIIDLDDESLTRFVNADDPNYFRRMLYRHWSHWKAHPDTGATRFLIPCGQHARRLHYEVEPDASAASYFFAAAAITGGQVTVPDVTANSIQGDVRFVELLERMGCRVVRGANSLTVYGEPLRGIEADMNDISDTVMTLAAVACFAEGPTTIRNVAHIRHKETDRLAALASELRRVGARVDELPDGLIIHPGPLRGAEIATYNDHRMAMSMALIGLRVPGIVITNPGCVAKTYPEFFTDLEKLRA